MSMVRWLFNAQRQIRNKQSTNYYRRRNGIDVKGLNRQYTCKFVLKKTKRKSKGNSETPATLVTQDRGRRQINIKKKNHTHIIPPIKLKR